MTIEEFRNKVIEEVIERIGDEYEVSSYDARKNNGLMLHGINVRKKGSGVSPTIYLDDYYKESSFDYIIDKIIYLIDNTTFPGDFDKDFFTDYDKVKENIYVRIINTLKNEEMLEEVPHREFLDLSIIVYCDVSKQCHMDATITIRNEHINNWKISAEELLDKAYENTRRRKCSIKDIFDIINKNNYECISSNDFDTGKMFVMSNEKTNWGAVCMTFDDVLDEFLIGKGKGVYIIPSSIHEVILIPSKNVGDNTEHINDIINAVNREELSLEEILSDHAYYYDSDEGYLSV